jgi:hypothetical protein
MTPGNFSGQPVADGDIHAYTGGLHHRSRLSCSGAHDRGSERPSQAPCRPSESQAIKFDPPVVAKPYTDIYGNLCHQILAPQGRLTMSPDFEIGVSGKRDPVEPTAGQFPVDELPPETLTFLPGSRFCETDRL